MRTDMCGIILAGGSGTRLRPLTLGVSKQLLSVYQQPMIYYPLKTLISLDIDDILIIVASELQLELFKLYLGDGSKFGIRLTYIVQEKPNGLAEAFIIGEKFIGDRDVTMILGDNVMINHKDTIDVIPNTIFSYKVKNPEAYGVVLKDEFGGIDKIVEKPKEFVSDEAVIGLYIFTNTAVELAKTLTPSARGELEIVDLIKLLNDKEGVDVYTFDGIWFDCGTPDDLLECAEFIRALTKRSTYDILLKEHGQA